jgi:hypothetical protein
MFDDLLSNGNSFNGGALEMRDINRHRNTELAVFRLLDPMPRE